MIGLIVLINSPKAWDEALTEGVAQAKNYAGKLSVRFTYATNGQGIYGIDMQEGKEGELPRYPTPDELWKRTFATQNAWRDRFAAVPFEDKGGSHPGRYYQDVAVERAMEAIADIVIDECHRGGANDESNWRDILEYFALAVQLGLTATPKRDENVDTYAYFGEPVYVYSLKEGINDGFLTPFRVKQISTTLDEYRYTPDDTVVEGEVEAGKLYDEPDFNKIIEITEREKKRVEIMMGQINQNEKTLVFCANQAHALVVRDLINQMKTSKDPDYCHRVTANDGALGDQHLRDFQNNDNTIPTILTTSQKLSTGVDARNIRNIVLMRPINSMIEFKQIIGRGTRLYEGKDYFTIYDFVDAHQHFSET
jgi:type I site-specific restriction endonuclease